MAVLVLGGYGLIGSAVVERLSGQHFRVVGLGRDTEAAARRWPHVEWRRADLARLLTAEAWAPLLADVDVVVNAAGALQQGLRDDLEAVQDRAMRALYLAAPKAAVRRVVQVSAVGVHAGSPLAFLSTKARADAALRDSGLEYVILRPGLVVAPTAYGGTALLRALAAVPGFAPVAFAQSRVQAVWIGDVADAVAAAVAGRIPSGAEIDLVERESRSLGQTVGLFRSWLGRPTAPAVAMPWILVQALSAGADLLGWLGWRSPLRSTAMRVMRHGVVGDGAAAEALMGRPLKSLPEALAAMPAGPQELWFARLWLLKAPIFAALAAFWLASGVLGLLGGRTAAAVLTGSGTPSGLANAVVWAASLLDIALGAALLFRPFARPALMAMFAVSLLYLAGGAMFAPHLWLDPLGPMVKVVPILLLILAARAILDER